MIIKVGSFEVEIKSEVEDSLAKLINTAQEGLARELVKRIPKIRLQEEAESEQTPKATSSKPKKEAKPKAETPAKKTSTKSTKAKKPDPAPTPEPETPPADAATEAATSEPEAAEWDNDRINKLRTDIMALAKKRGKQGMKEIAETLRTEYGTAAVNDIPPDRREGVLEFLEGWSELN